jgi:hypothetical protein
MKTENILLHERLSLLPVTPDLSWLNGKWQEHIREFMGMPSAREKGSTYHPDLYVVNRYLKYNICWAP